MHPRWTLFAPVAGITVVLDQITKYWARNALPTDAYGRSLPVSVIENFFDWQLAYNTGSAFSLFAGQSGSRVFLSLIALAAVGFIVWTVRSLPATRRWSIAAFALVAGGAVGNLIDRIAFGKVTDFVLWRYYEHEWPVFNVADAALCVGVGLLLVTGARQKQSSEEAEQERSGRAKQAR